MEDKTASDFDHSHEKGELPVSVVLGSGPSKAGKAASAAAGSVQVKRELGSPVAPGGSAEGVAAMLEKFEAIWQSPDTSADAQRTLATETLAAIGGISIDQLGAELAELPVPHRQLLCDLGTQTSGVQGTSSLRGYVYLAAPDALRATLGVNWLRMCSFDSVSNQEQLARLSALLSTAAPMEKILVSMGMSDEAKARLATLHPDTSATQVRPEPSADLDLEKVCHAVLRGPDNVSTLDATGARNRWMALHPELRQAILANAWTLASDGYNDRIDALLLMLISDPAERAPFFDRLPKTTNGMWWQRVTDDLAPLVGKLRAELGPEVRAQIDAFISSSNPSLAGAIGIPVYADRFPIVDKVVPPTIPQDHGFLDDGNNNLDESKREQPTQEDWGKRNLWSLKLAAARVARRDLADALRSYAHFLGGSGADLEVDYEKYLTQDAAGQQTLESLVEDIRGAAIEHNTLRGAKADQFIIQVPPISAGGDSQRFPYPATENWQKTIGGHNLWAWANVTVVSDGAGKSRRFAIDLHLRMEDRYNFNPGSVDKATGTSDAENGRFEITGLGKEFMSLGKAQRHLEFEIDPELDDVAASGSEAAGPVATTPGSGDGTEPPKSP